MPINDELIEKKILALNNKREELDAKLVEIRECRYNLQEIAKTIIESGTDSVPEIPIDRRTQKPFTDTARQKIYDDNIARANKILKV